MPPRTNQHHNKSVGSSPSDQLQKDDDPQVHAAKDLQPTSSSQTNKTPELLYEGHGILTQLTRNSGTITTEIGERITFKAKDFAESTVADLRDVLFLGFTLGLEAKASGKDPKWFIATRVEPLFGDRAERAFKNSVKEININSEEYNKELEIKSYETLIGAFKEYKAIAVPFNYISKYMVKQDEQVKKYIGQTQYEQRNFLKSRFHIFYYLKNDWVRLHHPRMYKVCVNLSAWLLRNGGCTTAHNFFHQYVKLMYPNTPPEEAKTRHLQEFKCCMEGNKTAFNMFGLYVSVRRSFPLDFDYLSHVGEFFPDLMELVRLEKEQQLKLEEIAFLEKRKKEMEESQNLVEAFRPKQVDTSGNPGLSRKSRNPKEQFEVSEARKLAIQWMETLEAEAVVSEFGTYSELTDEETLDAVFSELQIKGRVPKFQVEYSNQKFDDEEK
ncbi:unnamed protein product [Caenorhabditis brenneri]